MVQVGQGLATEPARCYITTIAGVGSLPGFSFALVPGHAFPEGNVPSIDALSEALGLRTLATFDSASELPVAIAGLLYEVAAPYEDEHDRDGFLASLPTFRRAELDSELLVFADYLAFADLLVIEQSPLSKIALAAVKVLAVGGGAAIGTAGFAISVGVAGPVLVVVGAGAAVIGLVATDDTRNNIAHAANALLRKAHH
jgi:hypothetical protein